jgi:hypothetical protein
MKTTLSDFIAESLAERDGEKWVVYVDGKNKQGAINFCKGDTEYEAKEDAWRFYQDLCNELKK